MIITTTCNFCRTDIVLRVQDLNRKGKYYCSPDCEHGAGLKPVKVHCRGCKGVFWAVKSPVYPLRCPACVAALVTKPKPKPKPKPKLDTRVLVIRELLPHLSERAQLAQLANAISTRSDVWWCRASSRPIKDIIRDIVSGI